MPQNINSTFWSAFVDSDDFLILPLYQLAVSLIYNPQMTDSIAIPSTQTLLLDMAAQIQLFYGCIDNWAHPTLLALNPWLSSLLNGTAPHITLVTGCGTSAITAPLQLQLLSAFDAYLTANPSDTVTQTCVSSSIAMEIAADLDSCGMDSVDSISANANTSLVLSASEALIPALVLGIPGAFGYMQIVGSPAYGTPRIVQNGVTANSSLAGLTACVANQFDAATLTVDFTTPRDPTCWPTSQQLVTMVRKRYYSRATNTSSCTRGLDALQYLQWLFTDNNITPILQASNFLRLPSSAFPQIPPAYVAALDAVLCDDTTLLITLPTVWSTSIIVSSFAYALSAVGILLTASVVVLIGVYFRHPVIRSSSPTFMLLSMLGILCLFLAAIVLVLPPAEHTCKALNWLWNLGFDLTFAPLFAKTWRIYQIFGRKKLSVIKITNTKLSLLVAGQLVVDLVLLVVWQVLSPLQPYITTQTTNNIVHDYTQCGVSDTGIVLFAVVCVVKGVLLLFGALMAFSTRHVSSSFNESSAIALTIYNVVFSVCVIVPIALLISALGDILLVLQLFLLLWVAFFSLTALGGTKVLHVYSAAKSGEGRGGSVSDAGEGIGRSAFSFASLAGFSSLPLLQAYVGALKEHLKEAEGKVTKLRSRQPTSPGSMTGMKGAVQAVQPARGTVISPSTTATGAGRPSQPSGKKMSMSEMSEPSAVVAPLTAHADQRSSAVSARQHPTNGSGEEARRLTVSEAWGE